MIYWIWLVSLCIGLLSIWIWLCLIASWNVNSRLVPKIQHNVITMFFQIYWYINIMTAKLFSLSRLEYPPIGCHKVTPMISKLNGKNIASYDMENVLKLISLPTRPSRSFYFFAGFVYPMLPLDFIGNKSETWERIYSCFNYMMNYKKIVSRSEEITIKYAMKLVEELHLCDKKPFQISDRRIRDIICAIMWELIFESEPEESDLKIIIELTQSITISMTYNSDPDWSTRINLSTLFLKQIQSNYEIQSIQKQFKLTDQEMCTVFAMELFITPALEISEVMANLMKILVPHYTELVQKLSCDSNLMRYAIIATAHHYPVLQVVMREVPNDDNHKDLTKCINLIPNIHTVEIPTQNIAESNKNGSVIDDINRCISIKNYDKTSMSEINTCMAFGKGKRKCKGKELAIKMITSFLTTIYKNFNEWPIIEISAGRQYIAFDSYNHRLYHWCRRLLIANIYYHCDKLFRRTELYRFQCQL